MSILSSDRGGQECDDRKKTIFVVLVRLHKADVGEREIWHRVSSSFRFQTHR